jgi:hypothetical protein
MTQKTATLLYNCMCCSGTHRGQTLGEVKPVLTVIAAVSRLNTPKRAAVLPEFVLLMCGNGCL